MSKLKAKMLKHMIFGLDFGFNRKRQKKVGYGIWDVGFGEKS